MLDIIGLGLNALPGIMNIAEGQRRAENPPQVGRQTGREGAVTTPIGGGEPDGGYRLDPFLREQINQLEAPSETTRGGFLNLFQVENPATDSYSQLQQLLGQSESRGGLSQSQALELQNLLREMGQDELAGELTSNFTQQTGGYNVDPGVRDVAQAGLADLETSRGIAERDVIRQLNALGLTQSIGQDIIPEMRRSAAQGYAQANRDETIAENRAITALRGGAIAAVAPMIQAQRLRDEITERTQDFSVAAMESQRVALQRRHQNELSTARSQLEQQFPGNPGLVNAQLDRIRSNQFQETGTLQNGLIADFARLENDVQLQTAGFVNQATQATSGSLMELGRLEAAARDTFQQRRTQMNLNKISNDMSISMLESQNRMDQAQMLRTFTELFVPEQELVNQIFSINMMLEDRRLAFEQGTFQQTVGGITQISSAVSNFQAQQAQAQAAREAADSGGIGGALGKAGGMAAGAILAAPTGGMSIAAGAALGGGIGTGLGTAADSL